jgi:anti-sigma B factor antagonist
VIAVAGEVDLATVERVQAYLDASFRDGCRLIVIDLAKVSFLDSAMLHALLRALRRARMAGGDMAVACDSASICRVLEVFGVSPRLRVYKTAAAAAAALSSAHEG